MKKVLIGLLLSVFFSAFAQDAVGKRALFVYDGDIDELKPCIGYFHDAMKEAGLQADEIAAPKMKGKDLGQYDLILIYGAVMAFGSQSPVRDWLKTKPDLERRKVALFVTANRWFLDSVYRQLLSLLGKDKADVVDAASAATQKLSEGDKRALVAEHVAKAMVKAGL
jgi:hypothetical protein